MLLTVAALNHILFFFNQFSYPDGDSDIEAEEDEFVAVRRRNVPPVVQQPLDADELEESLAQDDSYIGRWRAGTVQPDSVTFTGRSGLVVDGGGDTPLDYFSLMVNENMIEGLVGEPNCYAEQTLRGEGLEVEISLLSVAGRHCWRDEGLPRTDCRHGAHHRKHGKVL